MWAKIRRWRIARNEPPKILPAAGAVEKLLCVIVRMFRLSDCNEFGLFETLTGHVVLAFEFPDKSRAQFCGHGLRRGAPSSFRLCRPTCRTYRSSGRSRPESLRQYASIGRKYSALRLRHDLPKRYDRENFAAVFVRARNDADDQHRRNVVRLHGYLARIGSAVRADRKGRLRLRCGRVVHFFSPFGFVAGAVG